MFDPDKDVWDLEQIDRDLDEQNLKFAFSNCSFFMLVMFLLFCFAHPPNKRNVTSLVDLSMDQMPGPRVVLNSETTSLSSLSSHLNTRPNHPQNSPQEQNNGQATLVLLTIVLATIFALYLCPQD